MTAEPPRPGPAAARDLIERMFEALAQQGATPEVLRPFTRDEILIRFVVGLCAQKPGYALALQDLLADADKVLVVFGLHPLGPGPQAQAWGAALLCRVEDGLIAEHWLVPEMSDLP